MTATDRYSGPVLRYLAVLGAVAMSLALLPLAGVAQAQDAPDNPDAACPVDVPENERHQYEDHEDIPDVHVANVECATFLGIVRGFNDGTYRPRIAVRRDQMASFIAQTLDAADVRLPQAGGEDEFTDVTREDDPHRDNINRLARAGIVEGGPLSRPPTEYGPELRTRRDQMASFLMRAAGYAFFDDPDHFDTQHSDDEPTFPDVPQGNVHFGNVEAAADNKIAVGFEDGEYKPRRSTTRDQMASFVVRLLNFLAVPGDVAVDSDETATVGQPETATATVTDQFGNPVEGETVTFTAEHETDTAAAQPESATVATDADGEATFTFTSTETGTVTVTASIDGPGGNFDVTTSASDTTVFEAAPAAGAGAGTAENATNLGVLPIGALSLTLPALAWRRRRESELTPLA